MCRLRGLPALRWQRPDAGTTRLDRLLVLLGDPDVRPLRWPGHALMASRNWDKARVVGKSRDLRIEKLR